MHFFFFKTFSATAQCISEMLFSLNILVLVLAGKIINLVMYVCNLGAVWLIQDLHKIYTSEPCL